MNRPLFYKMVIFVLLFGGAGVWVFAGYLGWNLLITTPQYNKMMDGAVLQAVNIKDAHLRYTPKPLQISEETAILSVGTKADAVAKVKNPNSGWYIPIVEYQFIVNGVSGPVEKTWILPGDERYLTTFQIPANIDLKKIDPKKKETLPKAKLVIRDTKWTRVRGSLPKYPLFEFGIQSSLPDEFAAKITNKAAQSYWSVGVYAVRYGSDSNSVKGLADRILSVKYITVEKLTTLKEKEFRFAWTADSRALKTVLKGEVDIYDENNILPFDQGGAIQQF